VLDSLIACYYKIHVICTCAGSVINKVKKFKNQKIISAKSSKNEPLSHYAIKNATLFMDNTEISTKL